MNELLGFFTLFLSLVVSLGLPMVIICTRTFLSTNKEFRREKIWFSVVVWRQMSRRPVDLPNVRQRNSQSRMQEERYRIENVISTLTFEKPRKRKREWEGSFSQDHTKLQPESLQTFNFVFYSSNGHPKATRVQLLRPRQKCWWLFWPFSIL